MAKLNAEEYTTFESIRKADDGGNEFWYARELAAALQYREWRNFSKVIDRAVLACKNSGYEVSDHFVEVNKMVTIGSDAQRKSDA
jgi:DNA-damage-inducible protein D